MDDFPAVPEVLMPHPWGDPLPPVAEDAAALPCQDPGLLLHERVSEESTVSGKKRRRHGVLSLLKGVCKSLMGTRSVAPLPSVEELAVPVSRLEDDTPLVAWRQEYYVQSRLQHSPQLTVGEARVRPMYMHCCCSLNARGSCPAIGSLFAVLLLICAAYTMCAFHGKPFLQATVHRSSSSTSSFLWLIDVYGGSQTKMK